jgi:hypothetical protein
MSRPIARVALFALVGFVLIVAAYMTVQGVFAKAESAGVQAHTVSGLQANLNHDRSSAAELESLQSKSESLSPKDSGGGHGCERESNVNPSDF